MNIRTLISKEIGYRKINFMLSIIATALAAATFIITGSLLRSTDLETAKIIDEKVAQTQKEMAHLEDEIRKSMKGLGFNIYIFPEGQELSEVYEKGYASKTMPEEYATRLANSDIVTVNHLLPTLTQVIDWPEYKRKVVLIGLRGEVPKQHGKPKKPLLEPVPEGELVIGFELKNSLNLKLGDVVKLRDKEFTITKFHEERGTKDDITVWMNLNEAQLMLDKEGQINSILALECNCATIDRLGEIRKELGEILPGTKIIEQGSKALARAESRNSAKAVAKQQVKTMQEERIALKEKREEFAATLVPLIGIICMAAIAFLTFINSKERMYEVGLLLALGIRSSTILVSFLLKAVLGGLLGGIGGIILALVLISSLSQSFFAGYPIAEITSTREFIILIICMPLFTAIAAWLPSFMAAQYDPAEVLRND